MVNPLKMLRNISREKKVVAQFLLPDEDLTTIAKSFGLSRERVRQIINKSDKYNQTNLRYAKKDLFVESNKFKCLFCGTPLFDNHSIARHKSIYCSKICHQRSVKFDMQKVLTCHYCQNEFYPFRYKMHLLKINQKQKAFCCIEHYWAYRKKDTLMKKGTTESEVK